MRITLVSDLQKQQMEIQQHKISYASDEEIIPKIVQGETLLFEVLIRRYNPLLYKIARSYGYNHQDAEDLMQETHFAAFLSLKTFRREASYKTWLTRIHLNRCYQKMQHGHLKYETLRDEWNDEQPLFMTPDAEKQDAEHTVMTRELGKLLEESLQNIPLLYRTVFVLREMEGFSVAETAALLKITPVNVKVRLNRAKAMLQKQLEKFYSAGDLYSFHLTYCDKIVHHVFDRIANAQRN